jgi:hypothetical protein
MFIYIQPFLLFYVAPSSLISHKTSLTEQNHTVELVSSYPDSPRTSFSISSLHQIGCDFQSPVGRTGAPFKLKRAMKERPSILYDQRGKMVQLK